MFGSCLELVCDMCATCVIDVLAVFWKCSVYVLGDLGHHVWSMFGRRLGDVWSILGIRNAGTQRQPGAKLVEGVQRAQPSGMQGVLGAQPFAMQRVR